MPHTEPQETDPAEAFEGVRRELSLLHRAVEGLTAARENIPDYSATLGSTERALRHMGGRLEAIEKSPAIRLTPVAMVREISEVAQTARAEDHKALAGASATLLRSLDQIDAIVQRKRGRDEQNRLLFWIGTGTFVSGILFWSILPGPIIRSLPEKWHAPEWMAAHMVGESTLWNAGARIIQAGNPKSWQAVTDAVTLSHSNREALDDCKRAARTTGRPMRCTIVIGGEERPPTTRSR